MDDDESELPILWIGSERGAYRSLELFLSAFNEALADIGLSDFQLSEQQTESLKADKARHPSGSCVSRKNPGIVSLMNAMTAQ